MLSPLQCSYRLCGCRLLFSGEARGAMSKSTGQLPLLPDAQRVTGCRFQAAKTCRGIAGAGQGRERALSLSRPFKRVRGPGGFAVSGILFFFFLLSVSKFWGEKGWPRLPAAGRPAARSPSPRAPPAHAKPRRGVPPPSLLTKPGD